MGDGKRRTKRLTNRQGSAASAPQNVRKASQRRGRPARRRREAKAGKRPKGCAGGDANMLDSHGTEANGAMPTVSMNPLCSPVFICTL